MKKLQKSAVSHTIGQYRTGAVEPAAAHFGKYFMCHCYQWDSDPQWLPQFRPCGFGSHPALPVSISAGFGALFSLERACFRPGLEICGATLFLLQPGWHDDFFRIPGVGPCFVSDSGYALQCLAGGNPIRCRRGYHIEVSGINGWHRHSIGSLAQAIFRASGNHCLGFQLHGVAGRRSFSSPGKSALYLDLYLRIRPHPQSGDFRAEPAKGGFHCIKFR